MKPVDKVCAPPMSSIRFTHFGYHLMLLGNLTGELEIRLRLSNGENMLIKAPRTQIELHTH